VCKILSLDNKSNIFSKFGNFEKAIKY